MALQNKNSGSPFNFNEEVKLLDAQAGISDGEWHRLKGKTNYTIEFSGIVDSTLEIRMSNEFSDTLANSEHRIKVGADITTNIGITISSKMKWIKIRKTVAGTDTPSAVLYS